MNDIVIIPEGTTLPAHLQNMATDNTDLIVSDSFLPRIVPKDGHMIFRKDGTDHHEPLGKPIKAVILAVSPKGRATSKNYYVGAYNPDSGEAPDCHSSTGVVPDPGCKLPQSQSCATCPHNAWGSGIDQAGKPTAGKRCSDRKELIVVGATALKGDIYFMSVPPKSLKPLSIFGRALDKHGVPIIGIVTTIGFDPEDPKTLTFSFGEFLDEASLAIVVERSKSSEVLDHVHDPDEAAPVAQVAAPVEHTATAPVTETPVNDDPFAKSASTEGSGLDKAADVLDNTPLVDTDADGVEWDERLHAGTKTKTADKRWKKKRGAAAATTQTAATETAETKAEPSADGAGELNSILDGWDG